MLCFRAENMFCYLLGDYIWLAVPVDIEKGGWITG